LGERLVRGDAEDVLRVDPSPNLSPKRERNMNPERVRGFVPIATKVRGAAK
jgi:hypothetical protein